MGRGTEIHHLLQQQEAPTPDQLTRYCWINVDAEVLKLRAQVRKTVRPRESEAPG